MEGGGWGGKVVGFVGAIIALAVVAIVISTKANTPNVLASFFGGLSNLIGVAISPITGQTVAGLSAGGLTGSPAAWTATVGNATGSSGSFNLGSAITGAGNILGGAGSLLNTASSIFGGGGGGGLGGLLGGGGGSGVVDTGIFNV